MEREGELLLFAVQPSHNHVSSITYSFSGALPGKLVSPWSGAVAGLLPVLRIAFDMDSCHIENLLHHRECCVHG